jgi:hypothetical protein
VIFDVKLRGLLEMGVSGAYPIHKETTNTASIKVTRMHVESREVTSRSHASLRPNAISEVIDRIDRKSRVSKRASRVK